MSCHGNNTCDRVGGSWSEPWLKLVCNVHTTVTWRYVWILQTQYTFIFTCAYIKSEEIHALHDIYLGRYKNCQAITGTKSFHYYKPETESTMKCYQTSSTCDHRMFRVEESLPLTLDKRDIIICIYDGKLCIAEINYARDVNKYIHVKFYHPPGPRTSFKMNEEDEVWVSVTHIYRN